MNVFILEDNAHRNFIFRSKLFRHNLTLCDNAKDAKIELQKRKEWDIIFLHHDLGGRVYVDSSEENTGYQVARFIRDHGIKYHRLVIHSLNTIGAKNIKGILEDGELIPFPILTESL